MFVKKLLIDLDGVLNEYNGQYDENNIPKIKSGAKEFIEKLAIDYELYLFTTRNKLQASKWLIENNIDNFFKDVTNVKISAYLHIDDRALLFNGNFDKTLDEINNFRAYWKPEQSEGKSV